jgi:hypothetical protein
MPTVVDGTRISHRRLILLCGCSTLYLRFSLPPGLTLGPHPSLVLSALSLRARTFLFPSPASGLYFCLPASCANISMFYLTHLWVVYHHSLVTSCTCHSRRLTYTLLIISYRLMAALAIPMPVPFGLLLILLH